MTNQSPSSYLMWCFIFVGTRDMLKVSQVCPKPLSSLGWDGEKLFGIEADHAHLTYYPHQADEEYFDVFVRTLSELVDDVCPSSSRPDFTNYNDDTELGGEWAEVDRQLAVGTAGLSITFGESLLKLSLGNGNAYNI